MFGAQLVEDQPSSLPPIFQQAEERLLLVNTLDVGLQRAVARISMDRLWQTASNATVTLVNGNQPTHQHHPATPPTNTTHQHHEERRVGKQYAWRLATLPTSCRPNMRQAFNMNNDAAAARVDIFVDGKI